MIYGFRTLEIMFKLGLVEMFSKVREGLSMVRSIFSEVPGLEAFIRAVYEPFRDSFELHVHVNMYCRYQSS